MNWKVTHRQPGAGFSSVRFILFSIAGIGFLLFGVQVIFPRISIPFFNLIYYAFTLVDFISHEMGHIVAGFLGKFIGVLGGTLAQIFLPFVCLLLVMKRKQSFLIALFSSWLGENLIQISIYVRDARTQTLELFSPGVLFGGSNPIHDWNYLLGQTGLLWADQILGWIIWTAGCILLLLSAVLMFARVSGLRFGKSH